MSRRLQHREVGHITALKNRWTNLNVVAVIEPLPDWIVGVKPRSRGYYNPYRKHAPPSPVARDERPLVNPEVYQDALTDLDALNPLPPDLDFWRMSLNDNDEEARPASLGSRTMGSRGPSPQPLQFKQLLDSETTRIPRQSPAGQLPDMAMTQIGGWEDDGNSESLPAQSANVVEPAAKRKLPKVYGRGKIRWKKWEGGDVVGDIIRDEAGAWKEEGWVDEVEEQGQSRGRPRRRLLSEGEEGEEAVRPRVWIDVPPLTVPRQLYLEVGSDYVPQSNSAEEEMDQGEEEEEEEEEEGGDKEMDEDEEEEEEEKEEKEEGEEEEDLSEEDEEEEEKDEGSEYEEEEEDEEMSD